MTNSSAPTYEELRKFFEENELAQKAAASLSDGKEILLKVDGRAYTFTKVKKKNQLIDGAGQGPDMSFTLPAATARELITKSFESVGQVGLFLFDQILTSDPSRKVEFKIHAGFLSLMTGGYLGILTAGGADVAKFMASKGLGNVGKLKETISKLRG